MEQDKTGIRPIAPKEFAQAASPAPSTSNNSHLKILLLSGVALALGLGVVLVVFVLPKWLASDNTTPLASASSVSEKPNAASDATDTAPGADAAPQIPARHADATREETQNALKEVLEQLDQLVNRGAEQWAKSEVFNLREAIARGEKAYREKRYDEASTIYEQAGTSIKALQARIPAVIEQFLSQGDEALGHGNSAAASTAFDQVLAIDEQHEAALAGAARAATLDQVLALVEQAQGYEQLEQSTKALAAYKEAYALDAAAPGAAEAIKRLQTARTNAAFKKALADGFKALNKNQFDAARKAFKKAQKLGGERSELIAARADLKELETAYYINQHMRRAEAAVSDEQWAVALSAFNNALKRDSRLSPALAGANRAKQRKKLDETLVALLAKPERLADKDVRAEAERVLNAANAIAAAGPRLEGQRSRLERAVKLATTPIAVELRSDNLTQVTVYRVGKLGSFSAKQLSLLPGRYTAIGSRDGYRDVRVEIKLKHGTQTPAIMIQCDEVLSLGN